MPKWSMTPPAAAIARRHVVGAVDCRRRRGDQDNLRALLDRHASSAATATPGYAGTAHHTRGQQSRRRRFDALRRQFFGVGAMTEDLSVGNIVLMSANRRAT